MVVIASAVPNLFTRRFLLPTDARQRQLSREAARGLLTRIGRGIYVDPELWSRAGPNARHVMRVRAVAMRPGWEGVISHASAAALLGWPRISPYPKRVHATDPSRQASRSTALLRWHADDLDDAEVIDLDGTLVTTPLRTLRDVLLTSTRPDAVAVADLAMSRGLIRQADATEVLELLPGLRGSRRARDAIRFADPAAESPGESFSRVVADELGFVPPQSQVEFRLHDGRLARVDFWWPEFGVVGEFDGRVKYTRSGHDGAEAIYHEKRREDALRRVEGVRTVARWGWDALTHPERLSRILLGAGVQRR